MKKYILSIILLFGSLFCVNAQENLVVTIDGTVGELRKTTSKNVPVFCANKWAITQQFYTAEEICKSHGTIESIAFKTADIEDENAKYPFTRKLIVYLVNTDEYAIDGNILKRMSASDEVFNGEIEFSYNSWVTIDIADFEYTGKNILICINDITGSNVSGGITFDAFVGPAMIGENNAYRALYKRSISGAFDATANITGASTILDTPVPLVQLTFKEGTTGEYLDPAQPTNFTATALSESEILLTWSHDKNTSTYDICKSTEVIANITDTSYIVKDLPLGWHCFKIIGVNGVKRSEPSEIQCIELVEIPDKPEDPGDEPEQPGDEPEQPGDEPEQPGDEPEQPGDEPEQPGDEPEQPGDEPEQPGDEPEQPGDEPEQPGDEPEQPGDEPEQPGDEPEQPGDEPEQPGDEPEQPGDEPEQPGDEPEQPGDEPEQPGDEPEQPGDEPEQPGDEPEQPGECIEELTTSLLLHPNPVNDKLYIVTAIEIEEVIVYDIFGKTQKLRNSELQNQTSFDVSGLNAGVYFVMIKTNEGVVTKRFVKN